MRVSMYFLHLELTFTLHYIITDKGLVRVSDCYVIFISPDLEQPISQTEDCIVDIYQNFAQAKVPI